MIVVSKILFLLSTVNFKFSLCFSDLKKNCITNTTILPSLFMWHILSEKKSHCPICVSLLYLILFCYITENFLMVLAH